MGHSKNRLFSPWSCFVVIPKRQYNLRMYQLICEIHTEIWVCRKVMPIIPINEPAIVTLVWRKKNSVTMRIRVKSCITECKKKFAYLCFCIAMYICEAIWISLIFVLNQKLRKFKVWLNLRGDSSTPLLQREFV